MTRKWKRLVLTAGVMLIALSLRQATITQAASFDCAKATSKVEKMICADAELSRLDGEMQTIHQQASQFIADPVGFRAEQRQWLKSRDTCKDTGCLAKAYRSRIVTLQTVLAEPKPCFRLLERKWPEVASGHYPVCVDLLKSMNKFCSNLPLCEWKVSPSVPSLSLPRWEELDPREHMKLIQHMYEGQSDYKAPEEQWKPIPSDVLRNIEEGKARLWRTWIDADRDGQKEYVVRLQGKTNEDKRDFYGMGSRINVADASMSRVDPRYSAWSTAAMDIVLHDNRAFIIGGHGDEFDVREPFTVGDEEKRSGKKSVCVFEYLKY